MLEMMIEKSPTNFYDEVSRKRYWKFVFFHFGSSFLFSVKQNEAELRGAEEEDLEKVGGVACSFVQAIDRYNFFVIRYWNRYKSLKVTHYRYC